MHVKPSPLPSNDGLPEMNSGSSTSTTRTCCHVPPDGQPPRDVALAGAANERPARQSAAAMLPAPTRRDNLPAPIFGAQEPSRGLHLDQRYARAYPTVK
jgi:hypothetical protein